MAHALTIKEDGQAEMAYVMRDTKDVPWHGLGKPVDHPMTSKEAMVEGGADWDVEMRPVYTQDGSGDHIIIPDKQALVRTDTGDIFQVFSKVYHPVQNSEAFAFFDGVVASGEAIFETVGTLRGGRVIWILARLPGDLDIGDGDLLKKYILLANSHNGTMQVTMKITPVRVVCQNTLELGLMAAERQVKFRHTANILNRMNDAREILGLAEAHFELFMRQADKLVEAKVTEGQVRDMAAKVFDFDPKVDVEDQAPRKRAAADKVVELFYEGPGSKMATASGTAWGAFNAFTAFIDHNLGVAEGKSGDPDLVKMNDQRLNISWFGIGQNMRRDAWDLALAAA